MALARNTRSLVTLLSRNMRSMSSGGEWGSGDGKGGGKGGSIRDAGGSFGKMEVAREEEYFRKLQRKQLGGLVEGLHKEIEFHEHDIKHHKQQQQLKKLHEHHEHEIHNHEGEIKRHKEAIERHRKRIGQLDHEEKKHKKDDD